MKPTSEIGSKEYNDEAYQELSQKSMEPCPGCNRTFMPDRLEVHLRSCLKGKAIVKEEEESKTQVQRPRGVICYLCGKEFGTASI